MKRLTIVVVIALLLTMPHSLVAQGEHPSSGVRVVEFDDGMSSWVYAFVRAEQTGPVLGIEDDRIMFGRDPLLMFACMGGEVAVVYRFDTELYRDDDNNLFVQYRLDEERATKKRGWSAVPDPSFASQMQLGLAAMGADSANPLVQMASEIAMAARMPSQYTAGFLEAARAATKVTLRVTDPLDGETHTDVFPLVGLTEAIESVKRSCP